jgi:hypothetical protein
MPQSLRSDDNRIVTCIEALEMGYTFIKTCSKCDFYNQNRALNMKALTRPHSELSLMWQCTDSHRLGDLYHHDSLKTPYRPAIVSKYNSYISCSHASNGSTSISSAKHVRLFQSPSKEYASLPSASSQVTIASDSECDRFRAERGLYVAELEKVRAEMRNLCDHYESMKQSDEAQHQESLAKAVAESSQRCE